MRSQYITSGSPKTKKVGEWLAKEILKKGTKERAMVIGLCGDLAGGKTTFLQGFAKGLDIKDKILSPTFVILKKFKITKVPACLAGRQACLAGRQACLAGRQEKSLPGRQAGNLKTTTQNSKIFETFYHIDCYRLDKPKEILALGFKEIIAQPQNIVAIEWADRIETILPKDCLIIKFDFVAKGKRRITLAKKRETC